VIGVDGSEELLEAARTRYPEVRFETLDLGQLTPATFGHVDVVWASFVAAPNHRSQTRVFIVVAQRPSGQAAALPIDVGTKQAGA
jgi:trans-aconitate methyltransferase